MDGDNQRAVIPIKQSVFLLVGLLLAFLALSCQSEPLPPQPSTNTTDSWTYTTNSSATGFAIDYLTGSTNNWSASTNWQRLASVPVVQGQTSYSIVTSNCPSPCLVVMWATNSLGNNSPWAGPVSYVRDPLATTAPAFILQ